MHWSFLETLKVKFSPKMKIYSSCWQKSLQQFFCPTTHFPELHGKTKVLQQILWTINVAGDLKPKSLGKSLKACIDLKRRYLTFSKAKTCTVAAEPKLTHTVWHKSMNSNYCLFKSNLGSQGFQRFGISAKLYGAVSCFLGSCFYRFLK